MAIPTDIPTLYAWYKAGSLLLSDGDEVSTWLDSSGHGRTMTGATSGASKPRYYSNQIAGYPAVEIVQADQGYLANASFGWLANLASHTLFIVYKVGLASASGGIITSLGGSGSECIRYSTSTNMRKALGAGIANVAVPAGEWHFVCGFQALGSQVGISVDGGAEVTAAISSTRGTGASDGRIGQDGGAWCDGRIAEIIVYNSALSAGNKDLVNTYLRDVYFGAAPGQNEQIRDTLSRRLWLRRRTPGLWDVTGPLSVLDADILDRVAAELRTGPASGGGGWGGKKWSRAVFTLQSVEVSPGGTTCTLQLLERRDLDVLLWDPARTEHRNASARQDGVARLQKGIGFTFARQSKAWLENPADPTSVVEAAQTERAINQKGEYLEAARANAITRSSFASGTTGLTLAGTAVNGSAIAVDTTDLLFEQVTTVNSLRFTAGSPHAAELRVTFPATASWPANTVIVVSVDHRTKSGEGLYWRLQRAVDSWYWNDTTGAWQSGSVDNALATHADRDPDDRAVSKAIDVGAGATTVTLSVFLQTGGTASRQSVLYHVQIEEGRYPTSRIVCDGSAVTRVKTELSHEVTTALKLFDPALGAFLCTLVPDWSSADLASTDDRYVYWMSTNGGADHDALYYDASAGAFVLERKVGANTYTATKTATVTRGVPVALGARWTSADGDLDLDPYTLSVFVAGVKGTDAVAVAPTFTTPETLYRGSDSSLARQVDGAVRDIVVRPYAPTDDEMAAGA
jgi:hypothetical protein